MNVDDLLRIAVERKASDLHLKVGNHPYLRIDGSLHPLAEQPRISPEEMLSMAFNATGGSGSLNFGCCLIA